MDNQALFTGFVKYLSLFFALCVLILFFRSVWKATTTNASRLGLLLLASMVLFSGFFIYSKVFSPGGLMGWDDAEHSLRGLTIARDITNGNWMKLWRDTNSQTLWGPGYAWLLAWIYIILGETSKSGSLLSLLFFLMSSFVLYRLGLKLSQNKGWLIGLVAASLMLTTPFAIQLSATPLTESTLSFLVLFALLVRLNVKDSRDHIQLAAFSFLTAFIFLTKYNYGILIILATLIADVLENYESHWHKDYHGKIENLKRLLFYGYGPFILIVTGWFFFETASKMKGFQFFLINVPRIQSSILSSYRLLYYPKLFMSEYSVFWWVPLIIVPFLIVGLRGSLHKYPRRIAVFFILSFLAATLHPLKDPRYFVPILPFLWLIMSYGLINFLERFSQRTHKLTGQILLLAVLVFFIIINPFYVYSNLVLKTPYLYSESLSQNPEVTKAIKTILTNINAEISKGRELAVWGTFAELSPALLKWNLQTNINTINKTYELVLDPSKEGTDRIDKELDTWLREHSMSSILTIYVDDSSPFFHHDYQTFHLWKRSYINAIQCVYKQYGWKLYREELFSEVGVKIRIYRPRM